MGLNPVPYRLYSTGAAALPALRDGVNFAVGGAGVFDNLGFTKTGDQITQLKELVTAGVYDPSFMAESSLILYGVSGNDYAAFTRNNAGGISATVIFRIVDDHNMDSQTLNIGVLEQLCRLSPISPSTLVISAESLTNG
jgi:hypothetical protein